MKKKIFIITGEYSGDIHAAKVAENLYKLNPDIEIEGIGGNELEKAGVKLFCNHKKMSAVGLTPKIIINHLFLGKRVLDYIKNDFRPDLVLLVDYGVFNLNMAKFLHKEGIKTFYYIPPQVWASRKWRLKTIKKYVDKVLCIFPFEKEMYEKEGIDVEYCGHPLVAELNGAADKKEFFERHELSSDRELVSIFPGSREFELKNLMKIFIQSAKILKKRHPNIQFCVSHAPNLPDKVFDKYLKKCEFKVIKGENTKLLSVSDALILASGTVALEASIYKTPMLIAYKGPYFFYLVYLLVRCIKRVSLPNIILNDDIVKELIQNKLTVKNIIDETEKLLYNKDYRKKFTEKIGAVKEKLSDKNSGEEAAKIIIKHL